MKTMPLSDVKARLSKLVDGVQARDEEILITRNGRAVAVLLSADQFEGWRETVEILGDKELMKEIERGLRTPKRQRKSYTLAELFGD